MSDDPDGGKGFHYMYVFFNYQVHFFYVLMIKGNCFPQNSSSSSASAFAAWSAQRAVSNFRGP